MSVSVAQVSASMHIIMFEGEFAHVGVCRETVIYTGKLLFTYYSPRSYTTGEHTDTFASFGALLFTMYMGRLLFTMYMRRLLFTQSDSPRSHKTVEIRV